MATLEGVKKYIARMGNTPSFSSPKQVLFLHCK